MLPGFSAARWMRRTDRRDALFFYHTTGNKQLRFDLRAQHLQELTHPGGVRGPGGGGDEIAVGVRVVEAGAVGNVLTAAEQHLGHARGIATGRLALQRAGGGKDLRSVANGRDGLLRGGEMLHDFDDARIQT